jgi:hypothetical protein
VADMAAPVSIRFFRVRLERHNDSAVVRAAGDVDVAAPERIPRCLGSSLL